MLKDYKHKQVIVQAMQVLVENIEKVAFWCGGVIIYRDGEPIGVIVPRVSGAQNCYIGDYIIKGATGAFYPIEASEFNARYEGTWVD